jgi:hypothetical protein
MPTVIMPVFSRISKTAGEPRENTRIITAFRDYSRVSRAALVASSVDIRQFHASNQCEFAD